MKEELENKEFDRNIQKKLSESKAPVPDYLWTNIDKEAALLETASLRKRLAWYRWTVASLVILLGGIVLFYQFEDKISNKDMISEVEHNEELSNTEEQLVEEKTHTETESEANEVYSGVSVSETEEENVSLIEIAEELSPDYVDEPENILEESFTAKSISETNEPKSDEFKSNSTTGNMDSENNVPNDSIFRVTPIDEVVNKRLVNEAKIESVHQEDEIVNVDNTIKNAINEKEIELITTEPVVEVVENEVSQEVRSKKENNITENNDKINEEATQPDVIEEVASVVSENDTSITGSLAITEPPADIQALTPVEEEEKLSKITASLFMLPNFSYRGFEASNSTHQIYNTDDETKLRLSFGANVGYRILDKITMKLGVGYRKFRSEIEMNNMRPKELPILMDPVNSRITIYSSMGTVVENDIGSFEFAGDDEDDKDLDDEDDFASLNYKEEQDFTLLDIPLTVCYEMGKGKLKFLIEGGVVTSISIISESKIEIANIHSPDNLVTIDNYHQTKKMLLGGTLGIGAKYNISRRLSVVGLPSYSTSFMDINKDTASTIRPNSFNFSLGLQLQF